jgi:hypothetical protein
VKLDELIQQVRSDDARVSQLLEDLAIAERLPSVTGEREDDNLDGLAQQSPIEETILKSDVFFPSTLPYDYPPLLEDRIIPITTTSTIETLAGVDVTGHNPDYYLFQWGRESLWKLPVESTKVVVSFYVEDYRFESFWNDAGTGAKQLLDAHIAGAIMPNYSMYMNEPKIIRMFQHYRSLWLARYWQEAGIPIIPDVQMSYDDGDVCWMGVPKNVPIAIQSHVNIARNNLDLFMKDLDFMRATLDALHPPVILYYADEKSWHLLNEYGDDLLPYMLWVRTRISVRGDDIKAKNKQKKEHTNA